MIVYDTHDIICQHDRNNPNGYLCGGDSARGVGMLALVGDARSENVIHNFVLPGGLGVRHPFQPLIKNPDGSSYQLNNDDPKSFTRDQLLPLMAGLWMILREDLNKELFWSHASRLFLCQNTHDQHGNEKPWYKGRDPLFIHHIGFMVVASKLWYLYWMLPAAWIVLLVEIFLNAYVTPYREQNQLIAMLSVYGKPWLKLYTALHPDWKFAMNEYWSGWRDQKEVGERIIKYVESRV